MKKLFYALMAILSIAACVQSPEVNPALTHCTPESDRFVIISDCPSALQVDSNSLFVLQGTGQRDTVLLYVNGGPSVQLSTMFNYYEQIMDVAYVQQPQMLQGFSVDSVFFPNGWDGADVDISKAAKMLDDAVAYFKQQGKTVFVMGASWGAYITQQWLSEFENSADKIVIAVGRLYAVELTTDFSPPYNEETNEYIRSQINKDYRPLLAGRNLDNVYYITALYDSNVGVLRPDEINWLEENNVKHFELSGNHAIIIEREATLLVVDLLFRG